MTGVRRRSVLAGFALLALLPAGAQAARLAPSRSADSGTLTICSVSGVRPLTGLVAFTVSAPVSAGGTQTLNIAVGTCATRIFYPTGVQVLVTESVPAGSAVTAIGIGGGESTIVSSSPAAGTATVMTGTGQSTLTFTTNGPSGVAQDCKVPNVFALSLTRAKTLIRKAACSVGPLRKVYSEAFRVGYVIGQRPGRDVVLAHNAPVSLTISRGPKP